jgi:DICT domain-containing protein
MLNSSITNARTPFDVVAGRRTNRAGERLLAQMGLYLEFKGLDATEPAVLLVCLPQNMKLGATAVQRYNRVASRGVFIAVVGVDVPADPGPEVRGARVGPRDPLAQEWSVIVLAPHVSCALIAREHDRDPISGRRFDYVLTHDRDLVVAAALSLLDRIPPPRR